MYLSHRKFFRFQWKNIYEFTCLLFGLATASYIFTKLMRPVIKILREKDFQSVIYLNDLLILDTTKKEC